MINLDKIKDVAGMFGTGLLHNMAPGIASGIINAYFHQWKVDVAKITEDVNRDRSLWGELKEEQREHMKEMAYRLGKLDFITAEWLINSIKKDFPRVASLLINWPEGYEWLERQIDTLKNELLGD